MSVLSPHGQTAELQMQQLCSDKTGEIEAAVPATWEYSQLGLIIILQCESCDHGQNVTQQLYLEAVLFGTFQWSIFKECLNKQNEDKAANVN